MSFLKRYQGYVLLSLAWLVIGGIIVLIIRAPKPAPIEILPPPPTAVPSPSPTPWPLRVYVSGAVLRPDVYEIPHGAIAKDAIAAAGGATAEADLEAVNMAQPLSEGMQVHVPRLADQEPTPPPVSLPLLHQTQSSVAPLGSVNINTASSLELEQLPGIGPSLAQKIIDCRPYGKTEDIIRVTGIGESKYADLEAHITVE